MAGNDSGEKVKAALEQLDQGVKAFFESDKLKDYLKVMGRFHQYSARNCILIASQLRSMGYPEDSRICGYNDWKKHFNRQVRKGERGIMILAPHRRSIEVEVPGKYDPAGNPLKEKREFMTFRPAYVFASSQTEGDPLPELVKRLDFEVDGYEKLMDALIQVADCPVIFEDFENEREMNGFFNPVKDEIHIRNGMSEAQTVKTCLHEILHRVLHPASLSNKTRQEKELEAEGAAFCVASAYLGIDTSDYSVPYVGSWSEGKSLKEMTACIENIKRGSDFLISKLDRILCLEMTKEESAALAKEEKIETGLRDAGIDVENVSVVADLAGTFALVAVSSVEDERRVMQMNSSAADRGEERISYSTINIALDNRPEYADLAEYGRGMYDSRWPMVTIRYTNVPGIIHSEMNIYDFQKMVSGLPKETLDDYGKYFKVRLSYTYMDRNYQRVLDIDLGHGRVDYLNYLPIEGSHIVHLKSHVMLLKECYEARSMAPDTESGMEFEDSMQEWAGYCREILNHNSDRPVLPEPPVPEWAEEKTKNISRSMEL